MSDAAPSQPQGTAPPEGWADALAPSLEDFASIADAAYAQLPDAFRRMAGDVVLQVADFADAEVLEDLGIEDAFELTGLYQGADLTRRSMFDTATQPSMVFLYRRPMLDEWVERGDITLRELIAHVVVHEVGHHFGLSDEQMEAVEAKA